ncbi:hypothetical protein [Candidatus Hodarchaeum mangrovi]
MKKDLTLKFFFQSYPNSIAANLVKQISTFTLTGTTSYIGVDIHAMTLKTKTFDARLNLLYDLGITETGALNFKNLVGTSCVFFVFKKDDRGSFNKIKEFFGNFKPYIEQHGIPSILLGIKSEVEFITPNTAKNLAYELNSDYYELEGETPIEIERVLTSIIKRYYAKELIIGVISSPDWIGSNLLENYTNQKKSNELALQGITSYLKELETFNLHLLQISSSINIDQSLTELYQDNHGQILIYDRGDLLSYEQVIKLIELLLKNQKSPLPVFIIGMNAEKNIITSEKGLDLETRWGLEYYESEPEDYQFFKKILTNLIHKIKF